MGDVAEVRIGFPSPIGDAVINDGPGLLLIVEKQPIGNTLEVTRNVEKALEALKPGLKDVDLDPTIFRPAGFIEKSLENLTEAMWIGLSLVVVILVAFLFDWRTAVISLIAIPLSLVAACSSDSAYPRTRPSQFLRCPSRASSSFASGFLSFRARQRPPAPLWASFQPP